MRPTRLELQGFASFREHTVLDFTDADLFVLSGPTGAGKSSVVDAMTFALYGSVSRYDDARLVEPVISQGMRDARVLLDFTADGTAYRVARRVQRTKGGGATTKEARLELLPTQEGADPVDLASGAKEVTNGIEELLGLTFQHFCRTVVLPQGAFQDFLHAKPGERQELLVRLLDLGVYRDVASRARRRADDADVEIRSLQPSLERVAGVTPEAIATVRQRCTTLEDLATVVAQAQPELDAIKDAGSEARAAQAQAGRHVERVGAVAAPDGLDALAGRLAAVDQRLTTAETAAETAVTAREQAEDAMSGRPTSDRLQHLVTALAAVPAATTDRASASQAQEAAQLRAVESRTLADEAATAVEAARTALASAEATHRVHALRDHLVTGDPCPLCQQAVATIPDAVVPTDLDEARAAVDGAQAQAQRTADAANQADLQVARAAEKVTAADRRAQEAQQRADTLAAELEVTPSGIDDAITAARKREQALADARAAERAARQGITDATEARRQLDGDRQAAMTRLRQAQGAVADLGAPAPGDDLAASWQALVEWAAQEHPRRQAALAEADGLVQQAIEHWQERFAAVREACTRAGVEVANGASPEAAVAAARQEATGQLGRLEERAREAEQLQTRLDRLREQAEVARVLGRKLDARNFEQWLLARGLGRLIAGASMILGDLSRGAYSLSLGQDNAFLVIDHRNADQERHARSLSGGETFLASLALALSLAEHVADLAARGSAKLESLFLDEGFGTLDADTLDTVAASIEELGASGRMVGVITHVQELATRLPIRFEIRKGPGGSTVDRIDS